MTQGCQSPKENANAHVKCLDRGHQFRKNSLKRSASAGASNGVREYKTNQLYTTLRDNRIHTNNNSTLFIPFDKLELAKNRGLVKQALQEDDAPRDEISRWVESICTIQPDGSEFFRIFAILVLCEKARSIGKFISQHIDDSYLPLPTVERHENNIKISQDNKGRQINRENLQYLFQDRKEWKQGSLDNFANYQWWTIAPFFYRPDNVIPHYVLEASDVLPFTEKKDHLEPEVESLDPDVKEAVLQGGFGDVFIVKIHPSHYQFRNQSFNDSSHLFALKRLKSKNYTDFKSEVDALRKHNYSIEEHLIPLLATIEKESEAGKYYLLFPKANGDLRHFWKTQLVRNPDRVSMIRWVAEQCLGIARALSMLHQDQDTNKGEDYPIYGRHGDIKASNILWFSKPGASGPSGWCLVLSDFGLMRFHRAISISAQTASKLKKTLTYQAPEFDITGAKISRKSDIWALGCTWNSLLATSWDLRPWKKISLAAEEKTTETFQGLAKINSTERLAMESRLRSNQVSENGSLNFAGTRSAPSIFENSST
ncbi:kinase-like domain-containing protein [Daldinia caldariorum]|uniref:kinase-like domain-containing protein n=1 Tax=Daldinia caldariorum TaxID=326644 RepID=UPI002007AC59|nr:kinase-like domain-containing protein [Daldinia caldariorum]KAI1473110.1 kinase-like domain-containing protein [Daldinia caldariorum]